MVLFTLFLDSCIIVVTINGGQQLLNKVILKNLSAFISKLICFNSSTLFSMVLSSFCNGNFPYELKRKLVSLSRQLLAVLSELNTVIKSNNPRRLFEVQWNPNITMYQGTGEITSLYRGIVKPGFHPIHFTVTGIGRAEKC